MQDKKLLKLIASKFIPPLASIHGISHWKRVEKIGLKLAKKTGADVAVVTYFSYLHDTKRTDDELDPLHGYRASEYVRELYKTGHINLTHKQLRLLLTACKNHTSSLYKTQDKTIATCLDADRLDIIRLGISPDIRLLLTTAAKEYTRRMEL